MSLKAVGLVLSLVLGFSPACSFKKKVLVTGPDWPPSERVARLPSREGPPLGRQVAKTALGYVGTPYRYGGRSPRGFDCSGLTSYVYGRFGYKLPRRAEDQIKAGWFVPRRKLRPGDLVFFKLSGYHVGIYIGEGQFVHAPRQGKTVEVQRLDRGYYQRKYLTARRIISRN